MEPQETLEFVPHRGIGSIAIGSPPPSDGPLGTPRPVPRLPAYVGTQWVYAAADVQVFCGPSGDVLEVEAWDPAAVAFRTVMLLGRPMTVVVDDLARLGHRLEVSGQVDAVSDELGLRLFAEDGVVASCTAFDPSRPMPLLSPNDLLASMGIAPIE